MRRVLRAAACEALGRSSPAIIARGSIRTRAARSASSTDHARCAREVANGAMRAASGMSRLRTMSYVLMSTEIQPLAALQMLAHARHAAKTNRRARTNARRGARRTVVRRVLLLRLRLHVVNACHDRARPARPTSSPRARFGRRGGLAGVHDPRSRAAGRCAQLVGKRHTLEPDHTVHTRVRSLPLKTPRDVGQPAAAVERH
jgi:hypothetical protein